MQLTGKLLQVLPMQSGTAKNGSTWKKQEFIIETEGQFPKKVCLSMWGDRINEAALQPGNTLRVDFDAESREYNGRWYTDLRAWKVEVAGESQSVPRNEPASGSSNPFEGGGANDDDLPF